MPRQPKKVPYTEADLVSLFKLNRIAETQTPEMARWLAAPVAALNLVEQGIFDRILPFAINNISNWNEEALNMHFISQILPIAHVLPNGRYGTFYEKTVAAVVNNIPLSTKTDFMVATGVLDKPQKPFFHFQEYKPQRNPSGDSMGQLLEAMLIGQAENANGKPMYGVEIVGAVWRFVTLKDSTYCVSKIFDSTDKDDLLAIIAILRHFIHILETELLDDI